MTRTLSVAGFLAVLLLAFWVQRIAGGTSPGVATRALPATVTAEPATAEDPAARAAEDLAAWPVAAGR